MKNNRQGCLFDFQDKKEMTFDGLIAEVDRLAKMIVAEMGYPEGSLAIYKNEVKSETNYPIQIREFRRSSTKEESGEDTIVASTKSGVNLVYVCTPILTIVPVKAGSKSSNCVVLRLSARMFKVLEIPFPQEIKERWVWIVDDGLAGEDGKPENTKVVEKDGKIVKMRRVLARYDIYVRLDSSGLLPYLEKLMRDRLKSYKSKEPVYGCCHLYEECSDARTCLNKDKIYATVCSYRKNLESGRIFYGKNKNS